mgnify:CR=1 FL=1
MAEFDLRKGLLIATISGVMSGCFAWGLAALVMGNRADRLGRRVVLVGSLLVFSLGVLAALHSRAVSGAPACSPLLSNTAMDPPRLLVSGYPSVSG